jgi:hypothetical protein
LGDGRTETSKGSRDGGRAAAIMDLATPAHYASLPIAFLLLLFFVRHLWFSGDIFDFFARMQMTCWGLGGGRPPVCGGISALSLMLPHNEHWSTIPILLNLVLYQLVGLHSYLPYIGLTLVAHVVAAHLLWRWMRRIGVDPWVATSLATVFLLLGAGAEDIAWSFQVAWVLSIDLGLIGLFLIDFEGTDRWGRDVAYWAVAVAALMCSGIGIAMVLLGGGVALLRRGWWAMAKAAAVPAAVYVVWLGWVSIAAPSLLSTTPATRSQLFLVPQYVWTGLSDAIQNTTGWTGLGGVLALGLAYWLLRSRGLARGPAAIAFAAPVAAVIFFAIVGVGRVSLGVGEAGSGRYAYVWVALLLPATALVLTEFARRHWAARGLIVGMAAVVAVNGVASLTAYTDASTGLQTQEMGEILGAAHLLAEGAPLAVGDQAGVEPVYSPNLTVAVLRSMMAAGKVPLDTPITATDTLDAALYLQVSVTTSAPAMPSANPPALGQDVLPPPVSAGGGCVALANGASASQIQLVFTGPGWVSVTPTVSGAIRVRLAPEANPLDLTAPQGFAVTGGTTFYLLVTASDTAPLISLPPGATTVCGVNS